jgi:hypothetical protein
MVGWPRWVCGKAEHHCGSVWSKTAPFMVARKQEKREKEVPMIPSRAGPSDLTSSQEPHFLKVPPPPSSTISRHEI